MKKIYKYLTVILIFSLACFSSSAIAAPQLTRSTVDRSDDLAGYQIHLIYVATKDSADKSLDINGQIDAWVKEVNNWLMAKAGHKFSFDTYQGTADVSFMQSKFTAAELCRETCDALTKLEKEYQEQDSSYIGAKTLTFVIGDNLDTKSCGWANAPGNLSLIHNIIEQTCNPDSAMSRFGLDYPAQSLVHELIHTFGIHHVCFDSTDLMMGSPECSAPRAEALTTLDPSQKHYLGSEVSDGVDLLKMPIWADGSGQAAYAQIRQTSEKKYLPQLGDGTIYAIAGQKSGNFDWTWEKNFYPKANSAKCQLISGAATVVGTANGSACTFDVPSNLRPGSDFTVTNSWVKGPWHGEANVSGKIVRKDYSATPCTSNLCFAGGSTAASILCWSNDYANLTFQQLVDGTWIDLAVIASSSGGPCSDPKYPNYGSYQINFKQTGTYIYRWLSPAHLGFASYATSPYAVVVNDQSLAEPPQSEVDLAQTQALELGKIADLAKAAADKAAADKAAADKAAADKAAADKAAADKAAAAKKKTTISCIKGKVTKKVSGINPKCPAGYKKK